jgi:GntR family transcriptional repressor for pyruvate dehydrogenase complex
MHGNLKKGEKLPTERQLAEDMAVSRASVREAIKSLEAMGIVNSIQGSGTYVTDSPETTINRPICALFALSDGTLDNILQLRILLEIDAGKDIIQNAGDSEIAELVRLAQYDYINTSVAEQAAMDAKFHTAIVKRSQNTLVKYLYTTLSSLMDIYREKVLEETAHLNENALTKSGHYAICDALVRRSAHDLESAIRNHLDLNEIYRRSISQSE